MMRPLPSFRRLVVLVALAIQPAAVDCQEYQCRLSAPVQLDDEVTLEQVKNEALGTYTMRLSYTGGQAWVGIGVNTEGSDKMSPAVAVIGRVDEDGSTSVMKYSLTNDEKDGSGVLPVANQNLADASFVQTETESILTYSQLISDDGITISDDASWIFAIGLPSNQWEGKHKIHGSFFLPLTQNCVLVTQQPTFSPTKSPTVEPTTAEPTVTIVEPIRGDTLANIGPAPTLAPTNDNPTENSAEANTNDSQTSSSSTTTNSTVTFISPTSTVSSSTMNSTSTTDAASTQAVSGLVMRKDVADDTHPLWRAHGWMLALAWGLLAPLAVGAAILRQTITKIQFRYANWYQIHFWLNWLVMALTVVGFALAVVATQQEGKPHFKRQDDTIHHPAGLAVLILALGQAVIGYFRPPSAPVATTAPSSKDDSMDDPTELGFSANNNLQPPSPAKTVQSADTQQEPEAREAPVSIRKAWEIQHRLTGVVVVALAWSNCHSGYVLMEENYNDNDNHTALFWGVTGGVAGAIFFLAYVVRMQ